MPQHQHEIAVRYSAGQGGTPPYPPSQMEAIPLVATPRRSSTPPPLPDRSARSASSSPPKQSAAADVAPAAWFAQSADPADDDRMLRGMRPFANFRSRLRLPNWLGSSALGTLFNRVRAFFSRSRLARLLGVALIAGIAGWVLGAKPWAKSPQPRPTSAEQRARGSEARKDKRSARSRPTNEKQATERAEAEPTALTAGAFARTRSLAPASERKRAQAAAPAKKAAAAKSSKTTAKTTKAAAKAKAAKHAAQAKKPKAKSASHPTR